MQSILIVRTSAFGDILQAFPVFEYLRKKFPHAQIDWVIEKRMKELVHPFVTRTLEIDSQQWLSSWKSLRGKSGVKEFVEKLRGQKYDVAFDLQGNIKSGLILAACRASDKVGFGWRSSRERLGMLGANRHIDVELALPIRQKYLKLVQTYFKDEETFKPQGLFFPLSEKEKVYIEQLTGGQTRPKLMVALCSKWKNKQIPEKKVLAFLTQVREWIDPFFYFVFGSDEEGKKIYEIASPFKEHAVCLQGLSFPLWQALMQKMDTVLSVDSAALHLAASCFSPTFSFFGPTKGAIFAPEEGSFIQGTCPYGQEFIKQCPLLRKCPTGACMDFSSEALFKAFQEWYQNRRVMPQDQWLL